MRSQTGVVVDGLRPRAEGTVPIRSGFDGLVKFTAALGKPPKPYPPVHSDDCASDHNQQGCYKAMRGHMGSETCPGVDLERALFLTGEYLFGVYRLRSDRPREYHCQVQVAGHVQLAPKSRWFPSGDREKPKAMICAPADGRNRISGIGFSPGRNKGAAS